eukprot:797021-Alexandrium_andersonii.AAC.1
MCTLFSREGSFSPAAVIAALRERADLRVVALGPPRPARRGRARRFRFAWAASVSRPSPDSMSGGPAAPPRAAWSP